MTNTHKILPFHLNRQAYVYVRQSSQAQVRNHIESQRCQLKLVELAQSYGWPDPVVLADDLGVSASGCHHREDFESLVSDVCQEKVGIIFSFDVSRLARNGRDWTRLLEFCSITHTLLADFQGIFDPKLCGDDRLVLGIKGTLSEMELESIKNRLLFARKNMAQRGELITSVGVGYVRSGKTHLRKDPDARVQHAVSLIFTKFAELRSVHKVYRWSRNSETEFPHTSIENGETGIKWSLPSYDYFHRILRNPGYAGAYAYGKTESKIILENDRKRVRAGIRKEMADWEVLIQGHHDAYITWEQYEKNLKTIKDNIQTSNRRSPKEGRALLGGALQCGHCYSAMSVHYNGSGEWATYFCGRKDATPCLRLNALDVDRGFEAELLKVLSPMGIEASLLATEELRIRREKERKQLELELEAVRYEASYCRRQFDKVDPENRLVASQLERSWNNALEKEQVCLSKVETFDQKNHEIGESEKTELRELGAHVDVVWRSPLTSWELKKQLVREVIKNSIALKRNDGATGLIIHWKGGDHTEILVEHRKRGQTDPECVEIIGKLRGVIGDEKIAGILNRNKKRTARGMSWTSGRVRGIKAPQSQYVGLKAAGKALEVSEARLLSLIKQGKIKSERACKWAPMTIPVETLQSKATRRIIEESNPAQANLI